ncbi:SDR family NAD(P)-dependent oxidoreductase [Moritella marina]|uniref:SDR family NAD(P)-dependent oxidoreductase n=1 Tax=Moritella marina TaxID=90736 RepID=UPI0037037F47
MRIQDVLENKWVLITGALGGIGKALVDEYQNNGYRVIATDIVEDRSHFNNDISFLSLDLDKFVESEQYASDFKAQIIKLTENVGIKVLVNNAAIQILEKTEEITREQWRSSFNVNLSAPFFLSQMFVNQLEKNKGSIVNISSIHASQTKNRFVAYATSKAALSSMTRNMVLDLGDRIRINAIEPAAIATDMLKAGFEGKSDKYKELEAYHPIRRIGRPKEVAKLSVFLSSDDAGFVQGACISASGGIQGCLSDPD